MTDEKILKELIKALCGEVRYDKNVYRVFSDQLHSQTGKIVNGVCCDIPSLTHNASALRVAYEKYWYRKRDLLRICETLGDDYLNIYKDILGDD